MHRLILSSLILSLVLATSVALGVDQSEYIDVDEIRPGMRGYGLTVFRGTRPERFEVEVIDVLHNFRPDQDLILIRSDHPVIKRATTIAGMSGSPIYIKGRLAGAYAYGWLFGKEPVAGVTPISNMLAELERPIDPDIWRILGNLKKTAQRRNSRRDRAVRLAGLPPYWGTEHRGALDTLREHAAQIGIINKQTPALSNGLTPVATPLLMSGIDDSIIDTLGPQLERFGLLALQAGGGQRNSTAEKASKPAGFVDGGAIGVQLIRGDISATAIGTVTHVTDKRLVAFGHPMMNMGQIAWPTTTARVLHVLASDRRSFKIAEAMAPLGTLIQDRQAAIVVDTRMQADTIPVTIRIHGVKDAPRTQWRMHIVSHRLITPVLTFAAIANALRATSSDRSHLVYTAQSRVEIEGHGTQSVEDIGYSPSGIGNTMALSYLRLFDLMDVAYGNPFEESRINGITVDLKLSFVRDVVTVVDIKVPYDEVDPGSRVDLIVTLRRFGRRESILRVPVFIPHSAAGQQIELLVEPGDRVAIEQPKPDNLSELLANVREGHPSTALVVSTKLPSSGLKLHGYVVRQLPGSAYDTLKLVNQSEQADSFATYRRKVVPLGQVVIGTARLKLDVRETARNRD